MLQDKIQMPMSSGGLVNYSDEYKSKMQFKPIHVVILIVIIIIVEFFLHKSGWIS